MNRIKAFCCWSGGKDCALSLHLAKKQGVNIAYLLNMISENGIHSRSHGISSSLIRRQAECMDIPLIQPKSSWEYYETEFKKSILGLGNIEGGVFGDIDLQAHRDWIEKVCRETNIRPLFPLWEKKREDLMNEFLGSGFKAIVCAVNTDFLGIEWLGKEINEEFVKDITALGNIDLCGEKGEYHSFVYDGPVFKRPLKIRAGERILRDKHYFLELEAADYSYIK